jgi:ribosomal protein S18 acetylase RimI-like enzyme
VDGLTVRRCERADERLLGLAAESMEPQVVAAGGRFEGDRAARALAKDVVFVAETEAGRPAGYVTVCERGDTLVVEQLAVGVADQGRHVGHLLLDWAEGYGVSRRMRTIRVEVEPDNLPARRFYARRGYAEEGDRAVVRELVHE